MKSFKIFINDVKFTSNKDLNTRIVNALRRSDIEYFDFLIVLYLQGELYKTLSRIRNLGNKSIECIFNYVYFYCISNYNLIKKETKYANQ